MTFKNGWTISVQWGIISSVAFSPDRRAPEINASEAYDSKTAEIAFIDPNGDLDYNPEWCDQVRGYTTPDDVLPWMVRCSAKSPDARARPFPTLADSEDD
jgi:hypothetical protein